MANRRRTPNSPWTTPPRRMGVPIAPSSDLIRRERRNTIAAIAIFYLAFGALIAALYWLRP